MCPGTVISSRASPVNPGPPPATRRPHDDHQHPIGSDEARRTRPPRRASRPSASGDPVPTSRQTDAPRNRRHGAAGRGKQRPCQDDDPPTGSLEPRGPDPRAHAMRPCQGDDPLGTCDGGHPARQHGRGPCTPPPGPIPGKVANDPTGTVAVPRSHDPPGGGTPGVIVGARHHPVRGRRASHRHGSPTASSRLTRRPAPKSPPDARLRRSLLPDRAVTVGVRAGAAPGRSRLARSVDLLKLPPHRGWGAWHTPWYPTAS